jgi:hypothetical protein
MLYSIPELLCQNDGVQNKKDDQGLMENSSQADDIVAMHVSAFVSGSQTYLGTACVAA